ncbi:MAG: response regulator [Victivallales bacterium]
MQNISSSLFQNRRALIADPDVPFVRSLKTFLEALGFEVRSAGSAEEAERMALESPPDLLITEILLEHPDSGFILAHRLRRRVPAVRIVIVSNVSFRTGLHFDLSDSESRAWIEADGILDKDIRFEQLEFVLTRLFKEERS